MVERKRFGREELFDILGEVSTGLERQVEAYLIGGLAMMHQGLKVATKDVDIVFKDEPDERTFEEVLGSLGFHRARQLTEEYVAMGATIIMERSDGMQFDIFVEEVCRKLRLTDGMRARAVPLPLDGNLRLMATSPEDLFLFKSVTDRDDDLSDMALLAGRDLDWGTMADELRGDERNRRYLPHYVQKLHALEEAHDVVAPGRRALEEEGEIILGINILEPLLRDGPLKASDASHYLDEDEGFANKVLDRMVELGMARIEDGSYQSE